MNTDPIADLLTRIRNAVSVRKRVVEIPHSKIKLGIVKVLHEMGYIINYKIVENPENKFLTIKVALKYDILTKKSPISVLKRISRPGLRQYRPSDEIPRVMNGLGICVLSTSKGIMTGKEAASLKLGGEILCYVY